MGPLVSSCSWPHVIGAWQLEYKGKGYFSGKIHTIKATVSPPGSSSIKHTIEGQWHVQTKDAKTYKVFTDVTTPKEDVTVGPLEKMEEFESRKLWELVSQGIREGDYETASREKSKIEVGGTQSSHLVCSPVFQNDQRQRRKDEVAAGTTWKLKHFAKLESDPACAYSRAWHPDRSDRSQMNDSLGIPILPRKRKTVTFTRTTLPHGLPRSFLKQQNREGASFWFGSLLVAT